MEAWNSRSVCCCITATTLGRITTLSPCCHRLPYDHGLSDCLRVDFCTSAMIGAYAFRNSPLLIGVTFRTSQAVTARFPVSMMPSRGIVSAFCPLRTVFTLLARTAFVWWRVEESNLPSALPSLCVAFVHCAVILWRLSRLPLHSHAQAPQLLYSVARYQPANLMAGVCPSRLVSLAVFIRHKCAGSWQ